MTDTEIRIRIESKIGDIPARHWDACTGACGPATPDDRSQNDVKALDEEKLSTREDQLSTDRDGCR